MAVSTLYALDPGTEQSALVLLADGQLVGGSICDNGALLGSLRSAGVGHLVIEQIASYGMPVGAEVFDTCVWSGRFYEAWEGRGNTVSLLPRKAVKLALCGSVKAKDANIRQAILDRFGGKDKAIGKKAAPGPLYGIKSHCWSSLALAITYQMLEAEKESR